MLYFIERYPEAAGFIPGFLSADDPRPAKEQIDGNYSHGGGWQEFKGFTLKGFDPANPHTATTATISYSGDPDQMAVAYSQLRDECIIVFQSAWTAIVQKDGSYEIARLD